jgi:hypothetical protein
MTGRVILLSAGLDASKNSPRNNLRSSTRPCGHVTVALPSPTRHTVLDIVGDLLTNGCQLKKLLFYWRVFGRFGKLPKLCRFVPKIISPIHATELWFADGRPRHAALDSRSAPARYHIAYQPPRPFFISRRLIAPEAPLLSGNVSSPPRLLS